MRITAAAVIRIKDIQGSIIVRRYLKKDVVTSE